MPIAPSEMSPLVGLTAWHALTPAGIYETHVPRSQFQHYTRIRKAEALALYPELLHASGSRGAVPRNGR